MIKAGDMREGGESADLLLPSSAVITGTFDVVPAAQVEEQELLPCKKCGIIPYVNPGVPASLASIYCGRCSVKVSQSFGTLGALKQNWNTLNARTSARAPGGEAEEELRQIRNFILVAFPHEGWQERLPDAVERLFTSLTATVQQDKERIAELERGWILCADKMPVVGAWYACTVDDNDGFPTLVEPLWLEPLNRWTDGEGNESQATVIAWQPLPEPYAAQQEE